MAVNEGGESKPSEPSDLIKARPLKGNCLPVLILKGNYLPVLILNGHLMNAIPMSVIGFRVT